MSMSTFVEGFVPPDAKFQKMLKAYRACEAAGVAIPADVEKFFGGAGEEPDEAGLKIDLDGDKKFKTAVYEIRSDMCEGYEIDLVELRKINPDIKIIRVKNCY